MSERQRPGLKKSDEELGFVDLTVHNAKSLQRMDARGLCDPYMVIALESKDGDVVSKKKTKVVKQNLQPTWDEEFAFNVQNEDQVFHIRSDTYPKHS
jgi:Ca2+-dependent lipid-binding protein